MASTEPHIDLSFLKLSDLGEYSREIDDLAALRGESPETTFAAMVAEPFSASDLEVIFDCLAQQRFEEESEPIETAARNRFLIDFPGTGEAYGGSVFMASSVAPRTSRGVVYVRVKRIADPAAAYFFFRHPDGSIDLRLVDYRRADDHQLAAELDAAGFGAGHHLQDVRREALPEGEWLAPVIPLTRCRPRPADSALPTV
jgi:hypothetical protein